MKKKLPARWFALAAILILIATISYSRINNKKNSAITDAVSGEINMETPDGGIEDEANNEKENDEKAQEIAAIAAKPAPEMRVYNGDLFNIFFHPLIAKPEIAFKGKQKDHFMDWYVTAGEFKKILNELYISDFVLVDINELYEKVYKDGSMKVVGKKARIPEGKKPMILSIDDLSYYEFVRENGSVHKLVIDDNGGIAAWTAGETGGELSYDLDIVTYVEEFIKQHPDFSIRGAKGIIALTGYEGVLGYQTQKLKDSGYEKEKEDAIAVVKKLKELGWHFASHSWGHLNLPDIPMDWFMNDTNRWDREVRPIVGDTDLYIYPFGAGVESIEEKHRVLRERGFSVFFTVGTGFTFREMQNYIYFDRRNIDGQYFRVYRNRSDSLFDINSVVDDQARRIR